MGWRHGMWRAGGGSWEHHSPSQPRSLYCMRERRGHKHSSSSFPKTPFPGDGTGGTVPDRALPSYSPCTGDKGLRHPVPDPAVGRGRTQEPRADSSDKRLLFLRKGLGNVPDCLSTPSISWCHRRQPERRALPPRGHKEQGAGSPHASLRSSRRASHQG